MDDKTKSKAAEFADAFEYLYYYYGANDAHLSEKARAAWETLHRIVKSIGENE